VKTLFVCLAVLQVFAIWGFAQTPDELNEGSKVEYDSANSIWRFKWWGRSGRTYFIQHSEDLLEPWQWVPIVESGGDSIKEWGFTTTSDKFFWRLKYTDIPTTDPEGDDFDGDGVGNLWEVQHGMSPFSLDSDGDGMSDAYEFAYGLNGAEDDRAVDADGDGVANGEDARPGDVAIGRIAVTIDSPLDGASFP